MTSCMTSNPITRTVAPALVGILLLGASACRSTASGADDPDPDRTPAVQTVSDHPVPVPSMGGGDPVQDTFPSEAAAEEAKGLLGMREDDLPPDVRIGRRGEDSSMLTEDYVLGRLTVGLDDDGSGFRVTEVTIELRHGPATFHLRPS